MALVVVGGQAQSCSPFTVASWQPAKGRDVRRPRGETAL
jgi:hypothetical protein